MPARWRDEPPSNDINSVPPGIGSETARVEGAACVTGLPSMSVKRTGPCAAAPDDHDNAADKALKAMGELIRRRGCGAVLALYFFTGRAS